MLIDIIIQHALLIFLYILGVFVLVKAALVFLSGVGGDFGLFLGTFAIFNSNDIKNTFDDRLRKFLKTSNAVNRVFYVVLAINLFVYLFTLTLI